MCWLKLDGLLDCVGIGQPEVSVGGGVWHHDMDDGPFRCSLAGRQGRLTIKV